jgi:hypothetical protein
MTPFVFRVLVIGSVATALLGGVVEIALIPPMDAAEDDMSAAMAFALFLIVGFLLVALVVAVIGLVRFRWWARPFYFWATCLGLLSMPFLGYYDAVGWAEAFYYLSSMLVGATIAAAYWSPISSRFDQISP